MLVFKRIITCTRSLFKKTNKNGVSFGIPPFYPELLRVRELLFIILKLLL